MEVVLGIPCGDIELEGRLVAPPRPSLAAVLCHPHPLMGGDMNSPPVVWVRDALVARGAAVLRFNFRGTGASGGTHSGGKLEVEDVAAALRFVAARAPEAPLALVGYSFGALMAAKAAVGRDDLYALGMIAPPCGMSVLPALSADSFAHGIVIVAGDRDEFCPEPAAREWARATGADVHILRRVDHFFAGSRSDLQRIFSDWFDPQAA